MKEERERTPLRIILQNFINHVENLETYRSENSYDKEFQDLKIFSESLKSSGDYSCKEGEKEFNRKKNRYKDILPFDYTRVTLSEYVGVPGSDYINANYIKGASGSPAYIASQGPLPHTVNDFWRMVVECEVQVIVMACNEEESGKHKCENYWVDKEGEEKKFGMVAIRLLKASTICPDFLVRTMQLKYVNAHSIPEERVVCQFHYGAWPDHGVPGLVRPLLEMVRLVRDTQASETLPVLVHCSAGCGRTGTICAIDYVWGLLRAGKLRLDFSLFKLVRDMRKQRIAMVQTKDQYILVHQAVRELFQDQLRMIHSHPYENIDVRGHPLLPAHSSKTTILHPRRTALASDEKQDGKEKETSVVGSNALHHQASVLKCVETVDAPPLPHKKRIHTVSSKQEKEVENLTQKQLSIASASVNTKIQSSFDGETLDKRDDKVVVVLEKNLKIMNPESLAKGSEKPSIEPLSRNVDLMNYLSPHSLCLEETVKASPNNLLPSSVCNIHHSITANQTEDTSNLQKPCIAKLKALFESNSYVKDGRTNVLRAVEIKQRLPQQVTRSHSLGAVRKPHKFTQFNAASPEIGFQPQQSSDLNETGRYKSASNIHVDVYSPKVSDGDETVNTNLCDLEHLKTPCASRSTSISHNKCESSNILQPHISSSYVQMAGGKVPGLSCLPEKPLSATHMFSASGVMHEDSRPALPIKRSKSLKVQSATDHFKLTLVKRSHGLTQEVSSSEGESNFPHSNLLECNPEISSHSRTSKECESLSRGRVGCSSTPKNIKCKCKVPPDSVRLNTASNTLFQISDLQESASRPIFTDVKSEIGPVHEGSSAIHKISNDSEYLVKFPEKKKVNEYFPKLNRDICRAQSLHVKREKTTPHVSTTFSQESEYVNVKTVDKGNNWRHTNEPLNVRVLSADDICKCVAQNQSNIPLDASNIVEDCSNYLLSEEFTAPTFNESQRIAAANARHKVDTVAGGLGIRERRNSFRCAVGQGVDEKSIRAETSDRESKWISRNTELMSVPYAEAVSMKREFVRKITNSPKRPEIINMQKKPKEWCKGVEPNVVSKNSPLLLNSTNSNDCKYVTSVKLSEKPDVNNVQKPSRTMEVLTVSSGVAQKNVGQNGKMQSDSSSFQTSPNVWKHSLCTGIKNSNYIPSKHNSKSPAEDLLPNSPKGNMHSEVHYHWPAHQVNVLPQKKGNSSVHHAESLGSQSNLNSVVPLEVDVDQVGASMRNNLQGKYEGAKTPVSPDNSTQANSAASTHFTRALEVFHQTAASIRTKFSRPSAGSGTNPTRTSESSTKVGMPSQNQLSLFRPQQNGNPKRDVRDIADQPKVLRKQQHYL